MTAVRPNEDVVGPIAYDYAPHQPYQQPYGAPYPPPSSRPPPPTGPPPAYYRALNRTYAGSLRPVLLLSCFASLCYLLLLGIQDLRLSGQSGVGGRYKTFTVVQGALFMGAAGIEVFGLVASYLQRLSFARLYAWLSLFAYVAVVASQVLAIVVLYTFKTEVISACSTYYQGSDVSTGGWWWDNDSNSVPMTAQAAASYCQSLWSRSRTWDIIWLLVSCILGALFVMFGFAYARQLADPSSVRTRVNAHVQYNHGQFGAATWQGYRGQMYDDDSHQGSLQNTYPPRAPANFYAPPNEAPPGYARRSSTDKQDGGHSSNAAQGFDSNAASSSRPASRSAVRQDEDDGRVSGETLRGDVAHKDFYEDDEDDRSRTARI